MITMELFRITTEKYSSSLTSSGSANRWNEAGQNVIYTGSARSLSTLELIVHRSTIRPRIKYVVLIIQVNVEDQLIQQIDTASLPANWRGVAAYHKLQKLGSKWYKMQKALILKVPSAVIPQEFNYMINVKHPNFNKKVKLLKTEDFFWDTSALGMK